MSQNTSRSAAPARGHAGRVAFRLTCLGCGRIRHVSLDGVFSPTASWWQTQCRPGCPAPLLTASESRRREERLALWQTAEVAVRRGWPAPRLGSDGSVLSRASL